MFTKSAARRDGDGRYHTLTLLIFTDLDGTLLDHDSYSWEAAQPALDRLFVSGIPLILASSKTSQEIARLHHALNLGNAPAIVENGAGLYLPGQPGDGDAIYRRLRALLAEVPDDLRKEYRGFGDMTDDQVAKSTGLSVEEASLARAREFSEPGIWNGTDAARAAFLDVLKDKGIDARSGGRFLTLSFGTTKAARMREIANDLGATTTIALGDAPNDREMLELADYGVIVRNDHGPGLPTLNGEEDGHIRRTAEPGPLGWNRAVLELLQELGSLQS